MDSSRRCARSVSLVFAILVVMWSFAVSDMRALAEAPERDIVRDAQPMGPPNQGLAMSVRLAPGRQSAGHLDLEASLANLSEHPLSVNTGARCPLRFRVLVYDAEGRCASPMTMDRAFEIPGPLSGGTGPVGPGMTAPPLEPRRIATLGPARHPVARLPENMPAGRYSVVVLAVDHTKGISSLLVSNLVTFDWPLPTE